MIRKLIPESVKDIVRKWRKRSDLRARQRTSRNYSREELADHFRQLGINTGDILYTHSSLRSIGFVEGGPRTVIQAMIDAVGKEGTVVFPTFTIYNSMYETVLNRNLVFDPATAAVTTGKIPQTFISFPGVKRSIHFTHSVAAAGAHAEQLVADHYKQDTPFGQGTPYEKMLQLGVKIVGLGVSADPVTFYHVFEDLNPGKFTGVHHPEKFPVRVLAENSIVETSQYAHNASFYTRRIDKNEEINDFFYKHMLASGKMHTGKVGDADTWWMKGTDFMHELNELHARGKTIYTV